MLCTMVLWTLRVWERTRKKSYNFEDSAGAARIPRAEKLRCGAGSWGALGQWARVEGCDCSKWSAVGELDDLQALYKSEI